jgi:hypothetical protein
MRSKIHLCSLLPFIFGAFPFHVAGSICPDYSSYDTSLSLPFDWGHHKPLALDATIQISIDGQNISDVPIDTGSTGLAVTADLIPNFDPSDPSNTPGYLYYSSSHRLWSGYWVPKLVTIYGAGNTYLTTSCPILVVTEQIICKNFCQASGLCRDKNPTTSSGTLQYLGIGFGVDVFDNSQAKPDHNPLLNVQSINGEQINPAHFRTGYIFSKQGLQVGITASTSQDFQCTSLTPIRNQPFDYKRPPACATLLGQTLCGEGLTDSGIPYMFLRLPKNIIHLPHETLPWNTPIEISFGTDKDNSIGSYHFNYDGHPSDNSLAPANVTILRPTEGLFFVNTGRHFFRGFDVLFDAEGGNWGLRDDSNVVQSPASFLPTAQIINGMFQLPLQ